MPINPTPLIPPFCKNCTHRFVCSILSNFLEHDTSVKEFNKINAKTGQSITSTGYICRYKTIDKNI